MGDKTGIDWTDATWNPTTGCTEVSAGCDHCYARTMAERLQHMGAPNYSQGFEVVTHPHMLDRPLHWRRPRLVFVNSMSDLFHARVPTSFVEQVWDVMLRANWHTYQILTKRPERLARFTATRPAPPHIWIGTSVEDGRVIDRIDRLRECRAEVRFLSCEPLIGPLTGIDLAGIHWVIAGGESGQGARPMAAEWARELRDTCQASGVPYFFKQWGGLRSKSGGRLLDGRTWDEMPARVHEHTLL